MTDIIQSVPENIEELVRNANNKTSWKIRLEALNILKNYNCQQSHDVIIRLAIHDKVFKVKEEAFRAAQALKLTKNGKPIYLGRKDIGFTNKDFRKLFLRIRRDKKMTEFNLFVFKEVFKVLNPEMFDVMSFEKGSKFDSWIEATFKSLPKPKIHN